MTFRAAIGLLVLPALVSSAGRLGVALNFHRTGFGNGYRLFIEESFTRYGAVRHALPPGSVIGYTTDRQGFAESSEPADYQPASLESLMYVRFALLPLVVAPNSDQPYVLADFETAPAALALARRKGLAVEKDFGGGLLLLARKDAR